METKLTDPTMMTSAQLEFISGGIKKRPRPGQRDEPREAPLDVANGRWELECWGAGPHRPRSR